MDGLGIHNYSSTHSSHYRPQYGRRGSKKGFYGIIKHEFKSYIENLDNKYGMERVNKRAKI